MSTPSPFRTIIESMFRIVDKDGVTVDFKLNSIQARLDANWTRRNIVPKPRQPGVSAYVIARFTAKCLSLDNRTCVLISHEADATRRLLQRAKFFLSNLKGDVRPDLGRSSQNEIFFTKTNSKFYIGTAGSKTFGHGDTITDLHLSEFPRYDDPQAIVANTFPATERGEITIEATGNGVGDLYHKYCVSAREGLGFKLHFFSWIEVPEYQLQFDTLSQRNEFRASLREELEEIALFKRGITLEQLRWRRERLTIDFQNDLREFKQAYPLDFDECFQSKNYGFFRDFRWRETDEWQRESTHLHILKNHPRPSLSYAIGADPSGGVGRDNAVAQVLCLETQEQVAEFASATHEPPAFADVLATLGRRFNLAYINVERNNHGGTCLARLIEVYPRSHIHRGSHGSQASQELLAPLSHYGTGVTEASRGILIGTTRRLLPSWTIYSPLLKSELSTFVETDSGKIEADSGCMDDRVMALCHAFAVLERAGVAATINHDPQTLGDIDPFSWEAMFSKQPVDRTSQQYH